MVACPPLPGSDDDGDDAGAEDEDGGADEEEEPRTVTHTIPPSCRLGVARIGFEWIHGRGEYEDCVRSVADEVGVVFPEESRETARVVLGVGGLGHGLGLGGEL